MARRSGRGHDDTLRQRAAFTASRHVGFMASNFAWVVPLGEGVCREVPRKRRGSGRSTTISWPHRRGHRAYEIAAHESLVTIARGECEVAELLAENLEQEEAVLEKLKTIGSGSR